MNESGKAVMEFVNYYDIDVKDILVIQDDLDMNSGTFKLKMNSSCGGHNGIRSIINHLNSDAFLRLNIGILNQYKDDNVIDFVLGKLSKEEIEFLRDNKFKDIIDLFIKDGNKIVNSYKQ
jgi:PTH1 family peptidyl-tRNA hydrolase